MPSKKHTPDFLDPAYWNSTIKMSLSKFFILCVLTNRPMHGYEIRKNVDSHTNGCCTPTEGTIYPVLKQFESGEYVTGKKLIVSGRERKVYTITDKGRRAFNVALKEWQVIVASIQNCRPSSLDDPVTDCCP